MRMTTACLLLRRSAVTAGGFLWELLCTLAAGALWCLGIALAVFALFGLTYLIVEVRYGYLVIALALFWAAGKLARG